MKAIVYTKYGPATVFELVELERPQPKDNEVLIRNHGSSINTFDVSARSGKAPRVIFKGARKLVGLFLRLYFGGLGKPKQKIPGFGFAGEIESIGKEVTDWKVGDHVYGYSSGAWSEYMTVPATPLARKPANEAFKRQQQFLEVPHLQYWRLEILHGPKRAKKFLSLELLEESVRLESKLLSCMGLKSPVFVAPPT